MSPERFDALTRTLGGVTTRRRFLVLLAALLPATRGVADRLAETPTSGPADAVPAGRYPTPLADAFGTCPATGKGGDPDLNVLKNRVDAVAPDAWVPVTVGAILALPEPEGTTRYLVNWPVAAKQVVDRYLGAPVRVEAFVIGAKRSGGETTNCNSGTSGKEEEVDYHLTFAAAGDTFDRALVTEATPRVRAEHPSWTFETFGGLVVEETPVRVSGWLMLDTRHADNVGQVRGTRWEIHPVMRIEALRGGEWVDLDAAVPIPLPPETETPSNEPSVAPTESGDQCDPSYPTVCIPSPPPDLNCTDIPYRRFRVVGDDPHNFDSDGDGVGCES